MKAPDRGTTCYEGGCYFTNFKVRPPVVPDPLHRLLTGEEPLGVNSMAAVEPHSWRSDFCGALSLGLRKPAPGFGSEAVPDRENL